MSQMTCPLRPSPIEGMVAPNPDDDYTQFKIELLRKNFKDEFTQADKKQRLKRSVSIANSDQWCKQNRKRAFKDEIDSTYADYKRKQLWLKNIGEIQGTEEPPKPKYYKPTLEEHCYYCTEGDCSHCSICEQLEEQRMWETTP